MRKLSLLLLAILGIFFLSSCGTDSTTTYQVSISAVPSEGGTVSPTAGKYENGKKLDISAVPADSSWQFDHWSGDFQGTSASATITVNKAKNIKAHFSKNNFDLTINTEGEGTVVQKILETSSVTGYKAGTEVQLTAKPDTGYKFVKWTGDISTSENPTSITVNQPKEITVVFEKKSFVITVSTDGEGSVSKNPDRDKYKYNSTVELTAKPNVGWKFVEWKGDISTNKNPIQITVDGTKQIIAIFEKENNFPKTFGGSKSENTSSICRIQNNGFVITGSTSSVDGDFSGTDVGYVDIFVMKFDSKGNKQWVKTFGGKDVESGISIIHTQDDGFALTGYTNSNDGDFYGMHKGGRDIFIIKLNSNGKKQWIKTYGGYRSDWGSSIDQTPKGDFVITGFTKRSSYGNRDIILIKTDNSGNVKWNKKIGGVQSDEGTSIIATKDDGVVFAGYTKSNDDIFKGMNHSGNNANSDIFLTKVNSKGSIQWVKTYGGTNNEEALSLTSTMDGGYAMTGWSNSRDGDFKKMNDRNNETSFLMKLDSKGNEQWTKIIGGNSDDYGFSITQTKDQELVATGYTYSNDGDFENMNKGENDIFVLKLSLNGNKKWIRTFGGSKSDSGSSVLTIQNGNLIIAGSSSSNNGDFQDINIGYSDIFLLKANSNGYLY